MTATIRLLRHAGAFCCLVLGAACLGSAAPPLPAVRWFDPLPEPPTGDRGAAGDTVAVRVTALPHLGREFAVRVGAREVAFDGANQWLVEPARAVAIVAGRALAGVDAATLGRVELRVDVFELDVTAAPRAHVRVAVAGDAAGPRVVEAWADSSDREPASFAAAMAKALADVQARLLPR